jgi:hypothetical protein
MFEAMKSKKTLHGKLRCIIGAPAMEFEEANLSAANVEKQI